MGWQSILPAVRTGIDLSRAETEAWKVWLIAAACALVLAWPSLPKRWARYLLLSLTLGATWNYARWGPDIPFKRVDTYDLIHYYLNARYFEELGYYDLYPAVILADHQSGGPHFKEGNKYLAQNEAGHGFMPIGHALERGLIVRNERFTPERWAEFTHDTLYLQREIKGFSDDLWREMIQDHGFNGTPVWTTFARPLARLVPVEQIKWLCWIDPLLLLGATILIGFAYGPNIALWAWLFLMVGYSSRWPTITWAYLRYDWVAGLMAGMAMLRLGRPVWAGALTAWSATLRFFPALWMTGPFALGIWGLAAGRWRRELLVLAGAFLVTTASLEGLSAVVLGPGPIAVHFENMMDHNRAAQLSSRRIGLALALPFRGEHLPKFIEPERKAKIESQKPLRFALSGMALVGIGLGLRRSKEDEAYALGFVPFFLLTTASYYYYVARVTLIILHASRLPDRRHAAMLLLLLATEWFANAAELAMPGHRVFHIGWQAWALCAYTLLTVIGLNWEAWRKPAPQREAPHSPA
jgi:hypothetical protein